MTIHTRLQIAFALTLIGAAWSLAMHLLAWVWPAAALKR